MLTARSIDRVICHGCTFVEWRGKKRIVLTSLFLGLLVLTPYITASSFMSHSSTRSSTYAASPKPTMFVQNVTVPIPKVFETNITLDVNINVTDAPPFNQFKFNLIYNTTYLDVENVTNENSMLRNIIRTLWDNDDTKGELSVSTQAPEEANGTGNLVTVRFRCVGEAECDLVLRDTHLYDSRVTDLVHKTENGRIEQMKVEAPIKVEGYRKLRYGIIDLTVRARTALFEIVADNTTLDFNNNGATPGGQFQIGYAVYVKGKSNVVIKNGMTYQFQKGLVIADYCRNITIINMDIFDQANEGVEVTLSDDVQIINSSIMESTKGVLVDHCENVTISGNNIEKNVEGIFLHNSSNCTIIKNTIRDHNTTTTSCGISLTDRSIENKIWNNNFLNNKNDAVCIDNSRNNQWNRIYPFGGNFWSEYAENKTNDRFSGTNRTILGPDGIGDEPRMIHDYNQDEYPLMQKFDEADGIKLRVFCRNLLFCNQTGNMTRAAPVAFFTDSPAVPEESFCFNRTMNLGGYVGSVSFNLTGGTFCKAIICRELLDGMLEVLVDNVPTACFLNREGNYVFVSFNCSGNRQVRIDGQMATRIEGDVDGNGVVNIVDVAIVAKHIGESVDLSNQ